MKKYDDPTLERGLSCRAVKRPVEVEAFQVFEPAIIETLEGTMRADPGDWVIKGVKGEFYPCKPDIFNKTYEVLDDRSHAEKAKFVIDDVWGAEKKST